MAQPLEQEPLVSACLVEIIRILPDDVELAWQPAKEFLRRAFDTTKKLDNDDAMALCSSGEADLWIGVDPYSSEPCVMGAAITTIEDYTNGYKVVTLLAMGGDDFHSWDIALLRSVEEYGRLHGCDAIEIQGRKGWGRWFRDEGFEPTSWHYAKEL